MYTVYRVTPCMGVWIETGAKVRKSGEMGGHTLYGCVD